MFRKIIKRLFMKLDPYVIIGLKGILVCIGFIIIYCGIITVVMLHSNFINNRELCKQSVIKYQKIVDEYRVISEDAMVDRYIDKICKDMKLPPRYVKALIQVESQYCKNAIGAAGEIGLMQVKLSTAQIYNPYLTKAELLCWQTNIYYGCLYLRQQIKAHGIKRGILAYNGGSGILKYRKKNGKYINEGYYLKIRKWYKMM